MACAVAQNSESPQGSLARPPSGGVPCAPACWEKPRVRPEGPLRRLKCARSHGRRLVAGVRRDAPYTAWGSPVGDGASAAKDDSRPGSRPASQISARAKCYHVPRVPRPGAGRPPLRSGVCRCAGGRRQAGLWSPRIAGHRAARSGPLRVARGGELLIGGGRGSRVAVQARCGRARRPGPRDVGREAVLGSLNHLLREDDWRRRQLGREEKLRVGKACHASSAAPPRG